MQRADEAQAAARGAVPRRRRGLVAKLSGKARVGRKLRCKAPRFSGDVEKTTFRWTHTTSSGAPTVDGRGRSYKLRKRDRGHRISCVVEASNDGGPAVATASQAVPR